MGFNIAALVVTTVILSNGVTSLTDIGNHYYLYDSTGAGPSLKYGGSDYVSGEFGAWTPIGAEKTASGYEVAWENGSADQYTVWNTDSNGNSLANIFGAVSGSSTALVSLETSFHQDFNGDGQIGLVLNGSSGGQTLTATGGNTTLGGAKWWRRGRHVRVPGKLRIEHGQQFHSWNRRAAIQSIDVRNCRCRAERCPAGRIKCGYHT